MTELVFKVVNGGNQQLLGTCKQCFDQVYLIESLKEFKNGTIHIAASCSECGTFNKLISRKESVLYKKLKKEGLLRTNGLT